MADIIKYIGLPSPWIDNLTGSGLTWTTNMQATVSDDVGHVAQGYPQLFVLVDDLQSPVSGGGKVADICARYLASRNSNARTNSALILAAANVAPTAGQVGYTNTGVLTTGYVQYPYWTSGGTVNAGAARVGPVGINGVKSFAGSAAAQGTKTNNTSGARIAGCGYCIYDTDEQYPIFDLAGNSLIYDFVIDGQRLSASVVANSGGGLQKIQLDFSQIGGQKRRKIVQLFSQDTTFGNFWLTPKSSVYEFDKGPLLIEFGDSLGDTSPDVAGYDCWPKVAADYLGCPNFINFNMSGSGYTTTPANLYNVEAAVDRAYADGITPDAVVIAAGINDTYAAVTFKAAVKSAISKAKTYWPTTPTIVFGSWAAAVAGSSAVSITKESDIAAAVSELKSAGVTKLAFVPVETATPPWISGTGTIDTPNNSGSSDLIFKNADLTHWAGAGHKLLGRRIADAIYLALVGMN